MSTTRHVFGNPAETAEACGQRILTLLEDALEQRDHVSVAFSGGTTPKLMFESMIQLKFDWSHVDVFFVDERVVPPTDDQSNFKLAQEHLLGPAKVPVMNVHRVPGELNPHEAAAAYLKDLETYFGPETPQFDVVHLGTGPDAHTASLFPGDPSIDDREGLVKTIFSESKGNWRVTLLPRVLLAARHTVYLVTGADKAEAVKSVLDGPYQPLKYPAQLVTRNAPNVQWFLDAEAARLVEPV